ncbi:brings lots of money 7 [Caerostris extrusa]|uniref:Brings lots of money 7 n=1 Tax=Caerostris extrusa TaxID=172846 RepID=A0AAV4S4Q4_CAEEX|nr:brings lots of money 7 [Caerostris extrusa]
MLNRSLSFLAITNLAQEMCGFGIRAAIGNNFAIGRAKNANELITAEIDINDAPLNARNLLTRGHMQEVIIGVVTYPSNNTNGNLNSTFQTNHVPSGSHFVQDKVFVGLEQAPSEYPVREKILGLVYTSKKPEGLQAAKALAINLVETAHVEFAQWQQTQQQSVLQPLASIVLPQATPVAYQNQVMVTPAVPCLVLCLLLQVLWPQEYRYLLLWLLWY